MSLNPLVLINQVIEEHGSAGIMGKHLAFLKDQLSALKEQLSADSLKTSALEAENSRLGAENENLRQQIYKLTPRASGLDDKAVKILEFFHNAQNDPSLDEIAAFFRLPKNDARYYLDALMESELVEMTCGEMEGGGGFQPELFGITRKSRKHVFQSRA